MERETHDFGWAINVDFDAEMSHEAVRQFACALDAAVIEAIERTISEVADGALTLGLTSGARGAVERRLTFRKGYQVAELPSARVGAAYASAAEAITGLRELDSSRGPQLAGCVATIIRDASGAFRIGHQRRDGCDFDTEVEATSALHGFDDPSRFAVIPFLEISWETEVDSGTP